MITTLSEVWPTLESVARAEGVLRLGAASLPDLHASLFASWIERGHHATMAYLARNLPARLDPSSRFPWARSAVVILVPYAATRPSAPAGALSHHVARYALGEDYHEVLDRILRAFESALPPEVRSWRYVDTGPLSDRALAANAGLGWIAKNGMLITEQDGSYTFIGTLLTSLENDIHAELAADRCGTCTRCLDACPTDAILPDRTLDSARCISYATIEHRGPLNLPTHGHVFGCDICQEVCPWNRPPAPPAHPSFAPRAAYTATPVTDLLRLTQADFSTLFRKSAIKRAKLAGMLRNVEALTSEADRGRVGGVKVTVEELREHLDEVLEKVEHGGRVTVYSGEKAVATIDPPEEPSYSHQPAPGQRFGDYRPQPVEVDFDPLEALMEDRRKR